MTVLTMSAAEITRFDTLMRLDRGEIQIADAMELLGLQRRQIMMEAGLWKDRAARRPRPYQPRYAIFSQPKQFCTIVAYVEMARCVLVEMAPFMWSRPFFVFPTRYHWPPDIGSRLPQ